MRRTPAIPTGGRYEATNGRRQGVSGMGDEMPDPDRVGLATGWSAGSKTAVFAVVLASFVSLVITVLVSVYQPSGVLVFFLGLLVAASFGMVYVPLFGWLVPTLSERLGSRRLAVVVNLAALAVNVVIGAELAAWMGDWFGAEFQNRRVIGLFGLILVRLYHLDCLRLEARSRRDTAPEGPRTASQALEEKLERVLDRIDREQAPGRISARRGPDVFFFDPRQIPRFRAEDKYVAFRHEGHTYLVEEALGALEERLAGLGFLRPHRSELVNPAMIRALRSDRGSSALELTDGQRVPVSRRRLAEVRRILGL